MKTSNDPGGSRRRLVSVAGAALILAGGVAVLRAFNPQPDPPKVFGILGITAADVIRLNVTNVAPDLGLIPSPCRIRFGFVNAAGAVLKSADVSVASGHSVFLTLNFFEAAGASDTLLPRIRANVRPVISFVPPDPCFTTVSAEVVDAITGRTNIYAGAQPWISATAATVSRPQ